MQNAFEQAKDIFKGLGLVQRPVFGLETIKQPEVEQVAPQPKPKQKPKRKITRQNNPLVKRGRTELLKQAVIDRDLFINGLDTRSQLNIKLLSQAFNSEVERMDTRDINILQALLREGARRLKTTDQNKIINYIMRESRKLEGPDSQDKAWRKLRVFWVVNP